MVQGETDAKVDVAEPVADDRSGRTPGTGMRVAWIGVALVVALLAVQTIALVVSLQNRDDLAALSSQIGDLDLSVGSQLQDLGSGAALDGPSSPAPGGDQPAAVGNLPRFQGGGVDAASGRSLSQLASFEYYSGENVVVDPGDGKARAYLVWAHWCPFCQTELPQVAEWQAQNGASFEHFELVSVTTAIDDTGDNPLVPYLDSSAFPFPVLVDEDGSLARKLGVNAFPFWVFTAPDGTVVGRAAGAIGPENLTDVFQQLEDMGTEAASSASAG